MPQGVSAERLQEEGEPPRPPGVDAVAGAPSPAEAPPAFDLALLLPVLSRKLTAAEGVIGTREPVIERLEELSDELRRREQQHQRTAEELRLVQVAKVMPVLERFESKNKELVERLKQTTREEVQLRARFDSLSTRTAAAKKTVAATMSLSLAMSRVLQEKGNLEQLREQRSTTWKHLESIIALRNAAKNQMLSIGTISAQLRGAAVQRRDYDVVMEEMAGNIFAFTFGKEYQLQCLAAVRECVQAARELLQHQSKLALLRSAQVEVRSSIAHVVSMQWK